MPEGVFPRRLAPLPYDHLIIGTAGFDLTPGLEVEKFSEGTVFRGRVSSDRSLRCRETEFLGQRQSGRNGCEGSRTPWQCLRFLNDVPGAMSQR